MAMPGTTWTSVSSGCVVEGEAATCEKSAVAGTVRLFNNTPPVLCTASVTTDCVTLPAAFTEVPELSERAIDNIYAVHYGDTAESGKGTWLSSTTPSALQKAYLLGLEDSQPFVLNDDGYYEKTYLATDNDSWIGSSSQDSGGGLTEYATLVIGTDGQVITMFPK
ncbi:hypothetical protein [Streptomyces prunicolor]